MGFQYSSLQSTEVTISGTVSTSTAIPEPNVDQTLKHASALATGAAQNLYTVTAGKTFYLMGVNVMNLTGGFGYATVFENDGSTVIVKIGGLSNTNYALGNGACPLHAYTTAQNVKINGHANIEVSVWGYEV